MKILLPVRLNFRANELRVLAESEFRRSPLKKTAKQKMRFV